MMILQRVSPVEWAQRISDPVTVYGSADFALLNASKTEALHCLLMIEGKVRLGIILGDDGRELLSPFSAPFGGFGRCRRRNTPYYREAVGALRDYAASVGRDVRITLPPPVYDPEGHAPCVAALAEAGELTAADTSYHFDLSRTADYMNVVDSRTRNKLRSGLPMEHSLRRCGASEAYAVIRANREAKGYPLRMSLRQVEETAGVVKADFFLLDVEGVTEAAAQVHHTAEGIVQVVYWGDMPDARSGRAMNLLAFRLFQHYAEEGLRFVDTGPASEHGVINRGLAEFKENIGCLPTPKLTFKLRRH